MAEFDPYVAGWEQAEALSAQQPENSVTLSGLGADPTHHIVLSDGIESVGFVLTDQSGEFDERTFRRFPSSTPASPYVTEKQDSWGGGFGQATFEDNRTKYWRSQGVDTTKDVLVLGPQFNYAQGTLSKAEQYLDFASFQWYPLSGTYANIACTFTPSVSWDRVTYLKFYMYPIRNGGRLPTLRVRICPDSGGSPNIAGAVHTATFVASTFDDVTGGEWVRVDISDVYAYGTSKWWIVWDDLGNGSDGAWYQLGASSTVSSITKRSSDESSWTSVWNVYFRIESTRNTFTSKFFDYKGQLYSLLSYDGAINADLYMNGWRGAPDTGGTTSQLKDSTQTDWATKITGDEVLHIVAGPSSGRMEDRKGVDSGISGVLTLDEAYSVALSNLDEYVVTNSDFWTKISTASVVSSIAGRVTDVAVADGVAYFTRANVRNIALFREYNNNGTWTTEGKVTSGAKGQFVQMVSDPVAGDTLWFGLNVNETGEYRPRVWQSEPADFEAGGLDLVNAGVSSGASGVTQKWVASSADCAVTGSNNTAILTVTVGQLLSASVGTTGGSGYNIGDVLSVSQAGSSKSARVVVDSVSSGEVTAVSVTVAGYDYDDTGTDIATIAITGGGTGCVLDITGVNSVAETLAYIDLYDVDDAQATYDIRNMTSFQTGISYELVNGQPNTTSVGAFTLLFDDTQGCTTPFYTANVVGMQGGLKVKNGKPMVSLDIQNDDYGAGALTSIGIACDATLTKSFRLIFSDFLMFYRSPKPAIVSKVDGDNITGLETFGDPETLWVFTETGFGQMKNNYFLGVPQREVQTARHANNGSGHGVSDVYLLFTWRGRLQRYFRQNMEDLGPDFPAGMGDIAGEVVDVVSYPGRVYVAIDAGSSGKSMILCHKGGGWHEVWTGFTGERIRSLYIQPIEGKSDKLWANVGCDLMWFPIALDSAELPDNTDYKFRPTGYIDSSWVYTGSRELDKVFRSILLTVDDATNANHKWDVYFKVDDPDASWEKVTGSETPRSASMLEYFFTGALGNISRGNRIRVRLYLETADVTSSPTIRSTQMRIYRLPEVKYSYVWITKLSSISINLRGDEERVAGSKQTIQRAYDLLDMWASSLQPLQVTSAISSLNGKQVVLSPIPAQLILLVPDEQIQEQTIQVQVNDI